MKITAPTWTRFALPLLLLAAVAAAHAEPASIDGAEDLGALLDRARQSFDVENEDAIFLLDELREDWTADGRRVRTVHQVVFIRTALGIRRHADLRVPYDGRRERLSAGTLRTWRLSDRRWIEAGPTARVETLPFAVDHAPDYSHRREMMLLHDGVELPCLLERVYTIEDVEPYRPGVDSVWSFARPEPAMISRLVLGFPGSAAPLWIAAGEAPQPIRGGDGESGLETLTFEMGPLGPFPEPEVVEAIGATPRVAWSTWNDWAALGRDLEGRFNAAVDLGDEARQGLDEKLTKARTEAEKAKLVADYVKESTRLVRYETGWWPAPRSADRTWETAYGNELDRTVLAAALYRAAGLKAELAFRGSGYGAVEMEVPTLTWTGSPGLRVGGEEIEGWFDSADAALSFGPPAGGERAVWLPARGGAPALGDAAAKPGDGFTLHLDLAYEAEKKQWTGSGALRATGALSPFDAMSGLDGGTRGKLEGLVAAVLAEAKVTSFSPEWFAPSRVALGFKLHAPLGERDELDRIRLELGDPGVLDPMLEHSAVQLYESERGSAVVLPATPVVRIELRLDPGKLAPVRLPEAVSLRNAAGRFTVTAKQDDEDGISVSVLLELGSRRYEPADWVALRELLLAAASPAGRALLLK